MDEWTVEELTALCQAVRQHGTNWQKMLDSELALSVYTTDELRAEWDWVLEVQEIVNSVDDLMPLNLAQIHCYMGPVAPRPTMILTEVILEDMIDEGKLDLFEGFYCIPVAVLVEQLRLEPVTRGGVVGLIAHSDFNTIDYETLRGNASDAICDVQYRTAVGSGDSDKEEEEGDSEDTSSD